MRKFSVPLVLALLVLGSATAYAVEGRSADLRADIEFARDKVYPSLVNISVVVRQFSGGRTQRFPAAGSGVIVSPAGHILTNFHVAGNTVRIVCTLPNRERIEAEVVAHDPLTDLSVLKLCLAKRRDPRKAIPFATLGNSDELRVGDSVLAMGNPMSLASSMTLGIVANPRRVFTSFTGSESQEMDLGEGEKTGTFTRWIQHDALILGGNSGGPLVNLKGEVVGINELGGQGMGFAIPSNLASHVLNQALMYGEVRRGWFGLAFIPVNKLALDHGALVSSVVSGGPGHKAGILPGDLLLALDGGLVTARFFEEIPSLYKRIADFQPGSKVKLLIDRAGTRRVITVTTARMEKFLGDQHEIKAWGVAIRGITSPMALIRRYPDASGILINSVRPGRPADAAKPRLRRGDVIVSVAGSAVKSIAGFLEILTKQKKAKKLVIELRRRDQHIITVLHFKKKKPLKGGGELANAWLGVRTQVLTADVAKALFLKGKKGFRITQVFPGTKAAQAGFKVGDIITHLNGSSLRAFRIQDNEILRRRIENLDIGDTAEFTLLRDGKTMTVRVILEETPSTAVEAKIATDEDLEYAVREITFMDRISRKWSADVKGLVVVKVVSGGWAYLAGLAQNDLIVSIQDRPVNDIKAFKKLVKQLKAQSPVRVKIFVRRRYRTSFVFIEPDWEKNK
jgi:S1-C subfamily serine protease